MPPVRPSAVAGTFYPGEPARLREAVQGFLERAIRLADQRERSALAIVAPHAGYVYSGPIAGSAFAALAGGPVSRVTILGPSHFVPLRGLALPVAEGLETPLGEVAVDAEARRRLAGLPWVFEGDEPHAREHSIEVELPFVQVLFPEARVVPLVVGAAEPLQVAEVIAALLEGPEDRVVVSSDLSHYLPYGMATAVDAETAEAVLRLDSTIVADRACGASPLNGLLVAAARCGWRPRVVDLRNSGDTAGDRRSVVGYGAFSFQPASER